MQVAFAAMRVVSAACHFAANALPACFIRHIVASLFSIWGIMGLVCDKDRVDIQLGLTFLCIKQQNNGAELFMRTAA